MSEKRSKYDTDPLDPDFPRRTEEMSGRTENFAAGPDAPPPPGPVLEDPTRRLPEKYPTSYPSVFVPPAYRPPAAGYNNYDPGAPPSSQTAMPPAPYVPPPVAPGCGRAAPYIAPRTRPTSRPVDKLGLPENIANVLPYAPFYIGLVAALIELLLAPRHETRTRFHAAQGLALHLAILALSFIFGFIGMLTGNGTGGKMLNLASFIFLIFSMWRVWEGRPHHLAPLDEATKLLNQKIEPRP